MLSAVVFALVAQSTPLGPPLPAGLDPNFQGAVIRVEEFLEKGDFAGAKAALALLPKMTVRYEWDDKAVIESDRQEFVTARNKAFAAWSAQVPKLKFVAAKPADITFKFQEKLPQNDDQPFPPGAVHFWSNDAKETRQETIISLKRSGTVLPGKKTDDMLVRTEPNDVHNEVAYAVTSYLGLGETKLTGTFACRWDFGGVAETRLAPSEVRLFEQTRDIVTALEAAVAKKQRLTPTKPKLEVDNLLIELPEAVQGENVKFSVLVTNNGNSNLMFRAVPDCGCLAANFDPVVAPGKSTVVQGFVNTFDYIGDLKKKLFLYSNDLDQPMREIRVHINVAPLFRFLTPEGPTVLVEDGGKTIYAYLIPNAKTKFDIKSVRFDGGIPAEITTEEWQGELDDPEMQEGVSARKGTRFTIKINEKMPNGRVPGTLVVSTTDSRFPVIRKTIYAQKGIVALPDMVYFGNIPKEARRANFLLSRPNRGFEITKIESDHPNFKGTWRAMRENWEYRVAVEYDGKSDFGTIETLLNIHTNDPRQPIIRIPVRAVVK